MFNTPVAVKTITAQKYNPQTMVLTLQKCADNNTLYSILAADGVLRIREYKPNEPTTVIWSSFSHIVPMSALVEAKFLVGDEIRLIPRKKELICYCPRLFNSAETTDDLFELMEFADDLSILDFMDDCIPEIDRRLKQAEKKALKHIILEDLKVSTNPARDRFYHCPAVHNRVVIPSINDWALVTFREEDGRYWSEIRPATEEEAMKFIPYSKVSLGPRLRPDRRTNGITYAINVKLHKCQLIDGFVPKALDNLYYKTACYDLPVWVTGDVWVVEGKASSCAVCGKTLRTTDARKSVHLCKDCYE